MKLALGTAQFGMTYGIANRTGQVAMAEVKEILTLARVQGVDTLDTAIAYGQSEQVLGNVGVGGMRVISKLPRLPDACIDVRGWVERSVQSSLASLKTSSLHGLLLHRPSELLEARGPQLYEGIQRLKNEGAISALGVSIYEPSELDAICRRYPVDIVQGPFNPLDRRMVKSGWLARLRDTGTEFYARSVFLQGLLLMPASERPPKFHRWDPLWRTWDSFLELNALTALEACIGFVFSYPEIAYAVVGVDSRAQLAQVIQATLKEIPSLPPDLDTTDMDLLNPARWTGLE